MTAIITLLLLQGEYDMMFIMRRNIEPGLLRIFRYFTAVAVLYFAIVWIFNMFAAGFSESLKFQLWGNFFVYLGIYVYLNLPQLEKRLKSFYLPLALTISSVSPIVGNIMYLLDPQQANIHTIINQSWLWLPILFVPLILIAWQYNYKAVLAFVIFTNGLELSVLLALMGGITAENITLVSVPLLRSFAFGIVGYIVNTMAATQRMQTKKLIQANFRLNQYLNTLEQLTAGRERIRLAGELHDTLAHTLSGLSINLEAIKTVIPATNTEAQDMLDHSLKLARSGLDETRRVLKALRAGPLEDMGLRKGLENLIQDASMRGSIPIDFRYPEKILILPLEVEQSIYRITQESLENILKHSNATAADVNLDISDNELVLMIHDTGDGFMLDQIQSNDSFGLQGLKERAASVGGKLDVQSQPGMGTMIHFSWERFQ